MVRKALVAATIAIAWTVPAAADQWSSGQEREVDEGYYMSVRATKDGWRIWQTETRDGTTCKAVKSAKGRPHPIPVGYAAALYKGTPFLTVLATGAWRSVDKYRFSWSTVHSGNASLQVRQPGDKFWLKGDGGILDPENVGTSFDPTSLGEGELEIVMSSYEYPTIYRGHVEEKAIFDTTGLAWAKGQLDLCKN